MEGRQHMTSAYDDIREYDIHIKCGTERYPGDDATYTCEVTFPAMPEIGSDKPITRDYVYHDLFASSQSIEIPIARAIEDIKAYITDPEEWTRKTLAEGGRGERIRLLRIREADYTNDVHAAEQMLTRRRQWLAEVQQEIAKMEVSPDE
jgi:hypothetical protein